MNIGGIYMKIRKLGNIEVSEIGMGCMGFSHGYGVVPDEDYAIEAIQKAHDFGCTFFDTAESYGDVMFYAGHNEQLVGKAIKPFRKNIILATKFHIYPEEYGKDITLYNAVRKHLETSMKNLQTDYVNLYYLHRVNRNVSVEEVAEVMGKLIKNGLICAWGMSQVSIDILDKAHKITPVSAVQNLYSMMERDCEKEIFPYCIENEIGVVPFSPIASGFLSGKITTETKFEGDDVRKWVPQLSKENIIANQPLLEILAEYSAKKNATNAQISLAWMLHKYPNVVPIPGSKNKERILENLGACNVQLTEEEFIKLENALNSCTIYGHRGNEETEQSSFGDNWRKR